MELQEIRSPFQGPTVEESFEHGGLTLSAPLLICHSHTVEE